MKIIILGAGQVGASVAKSLVSEKNDITVVDTDVASLRALEVRYDLRTIVGNAATPSVLAKAGAQDADMLISVTASDQTNLVACKIAKSIFNLPTRIARLRTPDYLNNEILLSEENFAVDFALCPDEIITHHITRLIEYPGALQVLEFGEGQLIMVAMRASEGGHLTGKPIREIHQHLRGRADARIVSVFRRHKPLLPKGGTTIEVDDEIFVLATVEHIRAAMLEICPEMPPVKRIMIAGGGNIGFRAASALEKKYEVKLIEIDRERCEYISGLLPSTLVLNGEATDENLLQQEAVDSMDLFISLTNDDEDNIMTALLAKYLGCKRVIALINRQAYVNLAQVGRIDIAVSPAEATIGALLAKIRRGDVTRVHSLRHGVAEALEIVAHGNDKTSKVVGRRIADIHPVDGASLGGVIRYAEEGNPWSETKVIMGRHDLVIEPNDHVIVFCQNKAVVKGIERLFSVSLGFL